VSFLAQRAGGPARLLAAIVVIAVSASCGGGESEEIETSNVVAVTVAAAHRGPIEALVAATGRVTPRPGAAFDVVAPEAARVLEMPKGVGDRIQTGDLLVRFEIPSLEAGVTARESDLRRAEARQTNAEAALTRVRGLFERGIAARKEVEDTEKEMSDAEAAVAEAKSGLAAARALLARCTVRARFDGVVVARRADPGDLVDPSLPEPILRVIELRGIEAGVPARIVGPPSYPPEDARVLAHPGAVDPVTSTATVRLAFVPDTALPAGTPVRVEIVAARHDDALLVPAAAVVREDSATTVFTVGPDGKAHRRAVTIGIVGERDAEVLSGIVAGDRVVVSGATALPDGAAVAIHP
jgi:multidrug efflux pump subunit AcrA (membrane-fusion protein)